MLDLDRFKEVNDTLGHHQGDELLVEVASRITAVLRPADTVARLGGDEFAVLLASGGAQAAHRVAERIGEALEAAFILDGVTVSVEASMGIGVYTPSRTEPAVDPAARAGQLLRHADIAMYEAKLGRTGISHFSSENEGARPARLALLGELREALNHDELVLHYQPKVAAGSGQLLGVEALVRWQHPTQGLLSPAEFIPVAEATTLIQRLTAIVIDKALAMSREWLDRGLRMPVAVNVSARSLLDETFADTVAEALLRADVPADHLCLELTESTIMSDPDRALAIMQQLRNLGVRLSVDDFGTGYSSMAYLKILPGRRAQGGPLVRQPDEHQRRRHHAGAERHRPGPQPGHVGRRRGGRGPPDPARPEGPRRRRHPGLLPRPADGRNPSAAMGLRARRRRSPGAGSAPIPAQRRPRARATS